MAFNFIKGLTVQCRPISMEAVNDFVNDCSKVVDSTRRFSECAARFVDEGIAKLDSLKHSAVKKDREVKTAFEDVRSVVKQAYTFVDKVDDMFYYGQDTEKEKIALQNDDTKPLLDLLDLLKTCMAKAEEEYTIFEEVSKEASQSCADAAEHCKHEAEEAKSKKRLTQAIGGTIAAGTMAAGVGTGVVLSVVAGVFTFGIGTVVGLGLTAAGAAVAGPAIGAGTAVVTHCIASDYEQAQTSFGYFASTFDDLWRVTQNIKKEVDLVRSQVICLKDSIEATEYSMEKKHAKESLLRVLDLLQKKFTEYYGQTSVCRDALKEKSENLDQYF
jgi:hypothetical protein